MKSLQANSERRLGSVLVRWYRANRILYPWRQTTDPYVVWFSEILLQQTRIPVVLPYYQKLLQLFPNVSVLAATDDSDFLSTWSGLGYYNRARNMLKCARIIVRNHGGSFPSDYSSLRKLPGIGSYTAGALRNLCFNELTPAMDGNIGRVLARLTNNASPIGTARFRNSIADAFLRFGKDQPPADYFQAWMELGEKICLPQPNCSDCPLRSYCHAYAKKRTSLIPRRSKQKRSQTYHWYFLMMRRADRGILPQQNVARYYVQNSERLFLKQAWLPPDVLSRKPLSISTLQRQFENKWRIRGLSEIRRTSLCHTVTSRKLHVHVLESGRSQIAKESGKWIRDSELSSYHTSSVTRKIIEAVSH